SPAAPAPFMLALHGATGDGERMANRWREAAERHGVIVLAPSSLERTWDVLTTGYGPDVARIDRALAEAFAKLNVDTSRVYIEGFSDGASYALSLGLANGDLFTHVIANSPGFFTVPALIGKPRFLFTHGTEDTVLPIARTSRLLVPQFQRAGYDVTYHEFEGGHRLTDEIMALSLEWAGAPAR
ncbi:MAG TPA: PHB depolymerase family esterase, partial [Dehalococcoidia bacterium]|nr:PHB depolymerase family esterase [Dehalococcoidia bacterium]